jgi:hypothetical protein
MDTPNGITYRMITGNIPLFRPSRKGSKWLHIGPPQDRDTPDLGDPGILETPDLGDPRSWGPRILGTPEDLGMPTLCVSTCSTHAVEYTEYVVPWMV